MFRPEVGAGVREAPGVPGFPVGRGAAPPISQGFTKMVSAQLPQLGSQTAPHVCFTCEGSFGMKEMSSWKELGLSDPFLHPRRNTAGERRP